MKIEMGEGAEIINCSLTGSIKSEIKIGKFSTLSNCNIKINGFLSIGDNCKLGGDITIRYGSSLLMGNYSGGRGLTIWCDKEISIGDFCQFAKNCLITDSATHSMDWQIRRHAKKSRTHEPRPRTNVLKIGDDCWFGQDCKILCAKSGKERLTIGDRVVVGAGVVVKSSLESDLVFYGIK